MANKNSTKKRFKFIFLIVVICVILLSGIIGYFVISYQAQAVTNDYTENSNQHNETESSNGGSDDATAVLSQSVKMFTDEEALDINKSITNVRNTNVGLYIDISEGTQFDDLGIGDIFYLDGSEESPLGETYIGKISAVSESKKQTTYLIETPMADEVFDVLNFDYEQVMTIDNVSQIETIDGVTVTKTNDISSHFTMLSDDKKNTPLVSNLAHTSAPDTNIINLDSKTKTLEGLLFECEVDLLKAFKIKKTEEFFEQYNSVEGDSVKVYKTTTGICYHRKNCACVGKSKYEISLTEAINEGYDPCYLCNPPVYKDNIEASLTLEGKIGLESIAFFINYDWDILNGNGIENLSISANGNFLGEVRAKANLKYELSGKTTEINTPLDCVKLQGLKEKLFPIAFVGYNGSVETSIMGGNQAIRTLTGAVPITIGAMIYIDINGNISVGASAYVNYNQTFQCDCEIVKDGKWVWTSEFNKDDPKINMGIDVEISGDFDACIGASLSVYVFNLNIVELAIAKIGGEAEGTIKLDWSKETFKATENTISGSYYMRLYCKLLELTVKLKTKVKLWAFSTSANVNYSRTLKDITLAEWGTKNFTRFSENTMSYSSVTAKDQDAIYYKDTDDKLVKEVGGYRDTLYDENFFSICGIDASYLYLLKTNTEGVYDIYRVSKDGGTNKKIIEDVSICLTIDKSCIYYVSSFDSTTILRFNRDTLKEEQYATFGNDVKFMAAQEDGFYVVTEENGLFASLFGGNSYCYLLDKSGEIIGDYGSNPNIENYYIGDCDTYYQVARMRTSGYLRSTASEIYWMSKDKSATVLAEGISGWNPKSIGIFTTLNNDNAVDVPYKIVLYKAVDGLKENVVETNNNQAFFTLCQSNSNDWYFFDQTDTELILYVMPEDFSSKKVIKTLLLSEIPYNLSECSMTIMDNRIYFYTMPDNSTSKILYRYDIV